MKYLDEKLQDARLEFLTTPLQEGEWYQYDYFYSLQDVIIKNSPSARLRELPGRELQSCGLRQYVVAEVINGHIELCSVHIFTVFKSPNDYNHVGHMIAINDVEYNEVFNQLEYGR